MQCLKAIIISICEPADLNFGAVEVCVPSQGRVACREAAYLGRLAPLGDNDLALGKR